MMALLGSEVANILPQERRAKQTTENDFQMEYLQGSVLFWKYLSFWGDFKRYCNFNGEVKCNTSQRK